VNNDSTYLPISGLV